MQLSKIEDGIITVNTNLVHRNNPNQKKKKKKKKKSEISFQKTKNNEKYDCKRHNRQYSLCINYLRIHSLVFLITKLSQL
jgi:hypothetical protein